MLSFRPRFWYIEIASHPKTNGGKRGDDESSLVQGGGGGASGDANSTNTSCNSSNISTSTTTTTQISPINVFPSPIILPSHPPIHTESGTIVFAVAGDAGQLSLNRLLELENEMLREMETATAKVSNTNNNSSSKTSSSFKTVSCDINGGIKPPIYKRQLAIVKDHMKTSSEGELREGWQGISKRSRRKRHIPAEATAILGGKGSGRSGLRRGASFIVSDYTDDDLREDSLACYNN